MAHVCDDNGVLCRMCDAEYEGQYGDPPIFASWEEQQAWRAGQEPSESVAANATARPSSSDDSARPTAPRSPAR